ncbi:MAG TPA: hypothetical protein VE779_01450 [Candidatus Angelobacter sp.]|nr:hypothetical protein [Candidatus Angelobacter sp.]
MLLAVLFMMAVMVITAMAVAPRFILQAKRDREEEMIHRGTEYMRAIKKYYKKFGRYPANIEQLENTNQIRFLRKRYKDPLVKDKGKDGEWKLLHYTDVQVLQSVGFGAQGAAGGQAGLQNGLQGGLQGANPLNAAASGATATSGSDQSSGTAGGQGSLTQLPSSLGNQTQGATQPGAGTSILGGGASGAAGQTGFSLGPGLGQSNGPGQGAGSQAGSATGQTGTNNSIFGNTGVGGQTFGGGAIVGVASKSKDPTIRIYNKKKTYDEWQFFYSPQMDTQNRLLRGPYNGQTLTGNGQQIGTPAGQLNQGQPGQQPGAFGQQNQQTPQQNQQLTPGGQFPPDQSQPQPQ